MVLISDAPYTLSFMDGLGRGQDQQHRSRDRLHCSEILNYLDAMFIHKGRTPIDELKGADRIFIDRMADFGFMWEWALERTVRVPHVVGPERAIELAWKSRMLLRRAQEVVLEPQGELLLDDIYLTPDARNLEANRGEEYKATWVSMRKIKEFLVHFKRWYWQICCYAKAMKVTEYDLFVFWVCGNYKADPPFPQVGVYRLKFEPAEIDRIWDMVRGARDVVAALKEKERGVTRGQ